MMATMELITVKRIMGMALVIANQAKGKRGLPNLMAILNKLILQITASKLTIKQQNQRTGMALLQTRAPLSEHSKLVIH
jgi:hypothetical protein